MVLRIEPRASRELGDHSTTEPQPQPRVYLLEREACLLLEGSVLLWQIYRSGKFIKDEVLTHKIINLFSDNTGDSTC